MTDAPTKDGRRRKGAARAMLLDALALPGGVSCAEAQAVLGDTTVTTTSGRLGKLMRDGLAVVVRDVGRTRRYFSTQAAADAWLGTVSPARLTAEELRSIKIHADKVRAAKLSPAPLGKRTAGVTTIDDTRLRPAGEAIITADTVVTLDTTKRPTARWQMRQEAPDERWPSFTSVKLGVDPLTGRAWESRA